MTFFHETICAKIFESAQIFKTSLDTGALSRTAIRPICGRFEEGKAPDFEIV